MRRLEYWLYTDLPKTPWASFKLVPIQTVHDHLYFDEILKAVKAAGFSYRVIETTEKIVEEKDNAPSIT